MSIPSFRGNPPVLVGRERELSVLREHLAAALAGQGSLVLIGGEAGIGKTALAEAVCEEAAGQGALVLTGRCFDLTETPPYGPWGDLFGTYTPGTDLPSLPAAFSQRGTVGAVESLAALFTAVQDFFAALTAHGPLLILLDDLHWADPASLDLLRFLARTVARLPLLMLVTYRAEELTRPNPLSHLFPALVRESAPERLDLRALDGDAIRSLLASRYGLPDPDLARLTAYLHTRAEGNPFFLGELVRTLEAEGVLRAAQDGWHLDSLTTIRVPPLLRQVIDGRIARVGAEVQRVIALAAVVGQEVPLLVLQAVGELDEETLLTLIEHAATANLLVETPDGLAVRFVHALIREAVYEGISPARRRLLHRQIAEFLTAQPHPDPDAVAMHFQRAADDRAVGWLVRAGERAQAAHAWLTAAARFEAALALMERAGTEAAERGWLLMRLSRLLRFVEVAKARTFADKAIALGGESGDRALAACAQWQRGLLDCFVGEIERGLADLEAGVWALHALPDERAHLAARADTLVFAADGRGLVVMWRAHAGHLHTARTLGEDLLAELPPGGDAASLASEANICAGMAGVYAALGLPSEAFEMGNRARRAAAAIGHYTLLVDLAHGQLGTGLLPYRTDDIAARRAVVAEAEAVWARVVAAEGGGMQGRANRPTTLFSSKYVAFPLLALEGDWDELERIAQRDETTKQRAIDPQHAMVLLAQGETERVWALVRDWLPVGEETRPGTVMFWHAVWMQYLAATLCLNAGDLPAAQRWLDAYDRWMAWSGVVLCLADGQTLRAQYYRQIGDIQVAAAHAECALAHATAPRQPLALLAAHRLLGELATDAGRFADAQSYLDASLSLAVSCAAPFERALTLLALAGLHAAKGEANQARVLITEVRAICTPLHAQPALTRADALDARLDVVKETAPAFPAGLSPREVEVLRLLAAGQSNREIADSLFLSINTVRIHVVHILQKTDTANRAAAASFAHQHGLA